MAAQRVTEWLDTPKLDYHERQLTEVYRSTVLFFDWLEKIGYINSHSRLTILDLATGLGANLAYMGSRFPNCKFIGVDLNPDFVKKGNAILRERKIDNSRIILGDWYNLEDVFTDAFDGVISLQTLGWLPEFREPLAAIAKLNPRWMAHSSLFYDGPVSATVETQTYDEDSNELRKLFYNVYSIPVVKKFLCDHGYVNYQCVPFEIDIDIPNTGEFRTYTEKTADGRRIQISGPVFMPWYFIAAERGDT
jgi:ubiquinone/menaquinone biosynthesis C-methylase UbiE